MIPSTISKVSDQEDSEEDAAAKINRDIDAKKKLKSNRLHVEDEDDADSFDEELNNFDVSKSFQGAKEIDAQDANMQLSNNVLKGINQPQATEGDKDQKEMLGLVAQQQAEADRQQKGLGSEIKQEKKEGNLE